MKRLLALLLLLTAALTAAPGRAQQGPTPFEPGAAPPLPPHALPTQATAPVGPAQTPLRCDQVLLDPQVSPAGQSPWREYRRVRSFSTERFNSAPGALYLEADRDGDPTAGPDIDAAGQPITITASLAELYGALSYFYLPGAGAQSDELRVELYKVGQINSAGLLATARAITESELIAGSWQSLDWEVSDPSLIEPLRALDEVAFSITLISAANSGSELWLDDLTASRCVPLPTVNGRVTRGGSGAAGALVLLVASDTGGSRVIASTRTAPDGTYSFLAVPVQPTGVSYRVWFLNQPASLPRPEGLLGFWAGPTVPQLSEGAPPGLDFEVGDLPLASPAPYAEVAATDAAPAVLRWGGREAPHPNERHQLCLYDPARGDLATKLPAQVCGPILDPARDELAFSLAPASFAATPALDFSYGRSYRWYVVVYAGDPRSDPGAQYGYSFYERAITPEGALMSEPAPTPTPQPGEPAAGVAGADWTLLIYMAADNIIGDPRRAPALGRPSGQLASLPALAAAYPQVNLVSYVDLYGPGGAQLCAYPPGGEPDCRLRAEVDSAAPQTLADFIAEGRSRYPAARTALLVVAPGQAAGSLALDETTEGAPAMSLAGLRDAYEAAGLGGAAKLDLVIYQAPLLGSAEALLATAPYAHYMVASPGQVWQLGPYRELVPLLAGPSKGDPAAVARGAVAAYATIVAAVGGIRADAWAAYDLGRAGALAQALDALADAVQDALAAEATTTRPAVAAARAAAQSYDASGNGRLDSLESGGAPLALEEDALVDLRDLASGLQAGASGPDILKQAAAALVALLDDPQTSPVIATAVRSGQSSAGATLDLAAARGLAVFFPGGDRFGGQATLVESYLHETASAPPGDSLWAAMLRAYLAGSIGTGPGGVAAGAGGGAQIRPMPGGFVSTTLYMPQVWQGTHTK